MIKFKVGSYSIAFISHFNSLRNVWYESANFRFIYKAFRWTVILQSGKKHKLTHLTIPFFFKPVLGQAYRDRLELEKTFVKFRNEIHKDEYEN